MSASSVPLFVGATTLVAALVTLCVFQMNAAKLERRINRRSRTLEGPVPGHRSLSSIGLNAEAAKRNPSSISHGLKSTSPAVLRNDSNQEPKFPPLPAPSTSSLGREGKLNSLETIQARSAALHGDGQTGRQPIARPLSLAQMSLAQLQPKRNNSDQEHEQGLVARQPKNGTEKEGDSANIPPSVPGVDPAAQTVPPKTPASKRAKRASVQSARMGSPRPISDHAPSDSPADAGGVESLGAIQSGAAGTLGSEGNGLPDIFAGLNEAELGMQGLTDDLSDIDGGGLPGAGQKTPVKSRR